MNTVIQLVKKEWGENTNIPRLFIAVIFLIIFTVFFNQNATAQGDDVKVIGQVVDAESGEGVIGANVYFEGTSIGAATDLDGTFIIPNVPAGEYTLKVQMIGYAPLTLTRVKIQSGEVKKLELTLQPEAITTDEVVVEARMLQNNEASLLRSRQKSSAVSDAISAEAISRSGSGDAAEAMKKVTGASIVDGKYVFVRGLGERYSSTQLNGAELPTSDPDKKAFQLDLLPTNLLDNIVTIKTFTPDRPGNFSGGIVDVGTKTFPDELTIKLSASTKYNTRSSYNGDFLTYAGGNKDWLGYDDGTRAVPDILKDTDRKIPLGVEARFDPEKANWLNDVSKSFNSTMNVQRQTVPVNQNYGFSIGNRVQTGKGSALGYMASLTYGRTYSFYDDGEIGRYTLNNTADVLNPQLLVSDTKGSEETNLGGLANLNYNINPAHQIGFNFLYSRSGISTARYQEGSWPQEFGIDDETHVYINRVMSYIERDIQSYQLRGEHYFDNLLNITADWSASYNKTSQDEPDRRLVSSFIRYFPNDTTYVITGSNFDDPSRYFRFLNDDNSIFHLNFSVPFTQWSGLGGKFKFGGMHKEAHRDFSERIFTYDLNNKIFDNSGGDVSQLFASENMGITRVDTLSNGRLRYTFGNTILDASKDKNNYTGYEKIQAAYAMIELPLTRRLKFIGGARLETTRMNLQSQDETQDPGKLKEDDILPSLNLIYNIQDDMNLRAAATQTLARPNFRELAPYSTKEFVNDVELRGNPNLKRTLVRNYDLRWEWFTRPGELLAVSGFYKKLENPIELAYDPLSNKSNPIVVYTNVDRAEILGAEFEIRSGLGYLTSHLRNFSLGSNLSIIESTVDIPEGELSKRRDVNPDASNTRVLQGQSDYIFNMDFTYQNHKLGTVASVNYNTFGERLAKVSALITPDVYEQPATQLDFNMSQRLFQHYQLKFSVKNILNSAYSEVYRFNGKDYVYLKYKTGITYGLGLSYNL